MRLIELWEQTLEEGKAEHLTPPLSRESEMFYEQYVVEVFAEKCREEFGTLEALAYEVTGVLEWT